MYSGLQEATSCLSHKINQECFCRRKTKKCDKILASISCRTDGYLNKLDKIQDALAVPIIHSFQSTVRYPMSCITTTAKLLAKVLKTKTPIHDKYLHI